MAWTKLKIRLAPLLACTRKPDLDLGADYRLHNQSHVSLPVGPQLGYSAQFSRICVICLEDMNMGNGHALFTAECSHIFHFPCIASTVKFGHLTCPVCRAKWREVPWEPSIERQTHNRREHHNHHNVHRLNNPNMFDDGEPLDLTSSSIEMVLQERANINSPIVDMAHRDVALKFFPEISAVAANEYRDNFTALAHLKAPCFDIAKHHRAPVDLVAVLDVSGSMAGTKLNLLKQAMSFIVQKLGVNDRLSVIAFSSSAWRVFPLRRITDRGCRCASEAINNLVASGSTNIAKGLQMAVKVLQERHAHNPVSAIILLSDGRDTHSIMHVVAQGAIGSQNFSNAHHRAHFQAPVHTFGIGADHDAPMLHAIAETSGGTFSFIQAEGIMQDAFAQCIGGLLSVVVQDLELLVSCTAPGVYISRINAGSYTSKISDNGKHGVIYLGDLYAEEERDVLVIMTIPKMSNEEDLLLLLQAGCIYKDPLTQEAKQRDGSESELGLWIKRPKVVEEGQEGISLEVDRQRNRLCVAEAIVEARCLAEQGDICGAHLCLQTAKTALANSPSALAGDQLVRVLEAELNELMQVRLATIYSYQQSGRAYVLSAQCAHLRQRATTRGSSVDTSFQSRDYQTQSMVHMVAQSQTISSSSQHPHCYSHHEQEQMHYAAPAGAFPASSIRIAERSNRVGINLLQHLVRK